VVYVSFLFTLLDFCPADGNSYWTAAKDAANSDPSNLSRRGVQEIRPAYPWDKLGDDVERYKMWG